MKKLTFKSIRQKLWICIVGTIVLIISLIGLLQTVFLEPFYEYQKEKNVKHIQANIITSIKNNSSLPRQELLETAYQYDLCIQLFDSKGSLLYSSEEDGIRCMMHNFRHSQVLLLRDELAVSPSSSVTLTSSQNNMHTQVLFIGTRFSVKNQDFMLFTTAPLVPLKSTTDILGKQFIYILIAALIIGIIIAFLLSRSLTKPILRLNKATHSVREGNFNFILETKTDDELGELTQNFNEMVNALLQRDTVKRNLIANVSHDLRTPLTMIQGYAEAIRDLTGEHKEKRTKQLNIIIEESKRLNHLITDMLTLSQMQEGHINIKQGIFDLAKQIPYLLNQYDLLKDKGYTFEYNGPSKLNVYGDVLKINQVILNLINNAVNYTGIDKRVIITIIVLEKTAKISVMDTGSGIPDNKLAYIWDKYYKVDSSISRAISSTGIGLSIVKEILTAHQASFGTYNDAAYGAVFWFELQLA
ncbi:MAG: signal transduction histidine kinase [Clostridia bacterium]|jgi:signal transduction histidine kinase|nr:signal transduction histidine kinase [Clostridia bacterium]